MPLAAAAAVLVAELEHGLLLGADEVHEHRAVAGMRGEDLAQLDRPGRR